MESEDPEINVPMLMQGQVIDLTSAGFEKGIHPSPPMAGSLPMSADPPQIVTVAPRIHVILATPQTSQDAPGGIIRTLHPPQPVAIPSQQRS